MKTVKIENAVIADSFMTRFKGLMLKNEESSINGLLLVKCSSIHTMFMKFPIQVIYLTENNIVLDQEVVKPWKIGKIVKGAKNIFEIPESYAINVDKDDELIF